MELWLVNDYLSCHGNQSKTLWHYLLESIDGLKDKTGINFLYLPEKIEAHGSISPPDLIIRNSGYFRKLNLKCKTISFVQDIFGVDRYDQEWECLIQSYRTDLIDVCKASDLIVYNSEFTRKSYPELDGYKYRIIPIGVDSSKFSPNCVDKTQKVLFIGSTNSIKGWDFFIEIVNSDPNIQYSAVLKLDWLGGEEASMKLPNPIPRNLSILEYMSSGLLANLMQSHSIGICTSELETQHLAGIEMGSCGLPLVTTNVGIYYNKPTGYWGTVVESDKPSDWISALKDQFGKNPQIVSKEWADFSMEACMKSWKEAIKDVLSS